METFWIIVTLSCWVSFLSLRSKNMLIALGASIMWLALMAYNLSNPPTNITQGSTIHEWMTMGFTVLAIATLTAWFRNRGRVETQTRISMADDEILARRSIQVGTTRSVMEMSPDEYKSYVRSRVRGRGR